MPDFIIILVMCFPMFLFTVYPAIKLGEYLETNYKISETLKRYVVVGTTLFVTLSLSSLLFYA